MAWGQSLILRFGDALRQTTICFTFSLLHQGQVGRGICLPFLVTRSRLLPGGIVGKTGSP